MSPCLLSSTLHNQDEKKSPRSHPTGNFPCDKLSLQSTCHLVYSPQFCIIKTKRSRPEVILLEILNVTSCLYSQQSPSLLPLIPHNQDCVGSAWWLFTQSSCFSYAHWEKFQAWSPRSPFTDWRCILDLSSQELDWKAWRICWEQSSWWHNMVVLCLVIFLVTFWTPLHGLLDIA